MHRYNRTIIINDGMNPLTKEQIEELKEKLEENKKRINELVKKFDVYKI
ncbi:hypothetical protein SAMN05421766_1081 [Zobellia uliginosa]|uniref:Uncharacterized protein n=1 Tax=Zobellia uliginosa TaxID=143224 RepID=A0ABY1L0U2_9FLAO|nr:hypothetical protein SAMN05421766_1081 [Zobellia uliginosa]